MARSFVGKVRIRPRAVPVAVSPFRLRPKPVGDFMDEVFAVYRQNFRTFFGIGALTFIPAELLQFGLELFLSTWTAVGQQLGPNNVMAVLALFITAVSFPAYGATIIAVADVVAGRRPSVGGSYRRLLPHWGRLAAVHLTYLACIGALAVTGIGLPVAVYLVMAWVAAPAAVALEDAGVWEALRRSHQLVSGELTRVAGIMASGALLWVVASIVFGIPAAVVNALEPAGVAAGFSSDEVHIAARLLEALGNAAAAPLAFAVGTLLYLDMRVYQEGLTLAEFVDERRGGITREAA